MILRPYQRRASNELVRIIMIGGNPILVLPTGGGKTVIFVDIAGGAAASDRHVGIFVHREELLDQVHAALEEAGIPHGLVADGEDVTSHRVHIASISTVDARLRASDAATIAWLKHLNLAILDECHHVVADQWMRVILAMPQASKMGTTATPWRLDGRGLGDVFNAAVRGPTPSQLVDDGWLAPLHVFAPPEIVGTSGIKKIGGDLALGQLQQLMNDNALTAQAIAFYMKKCFRPETGSWAPTLVFTTGLEHIGNFVALAAGVGLRCKGIDGTIARTPRRDLIKGLRTGELELLASCEIANEGTDIPGAAAGLMLRPSESTGLILQQDGRIARPIWTDGFDPNTATADERKANMAAAGKPAGLILDFVGNTAKHGMPDSDRPWSLEGGVKGLERQVEPTRRCIRCWRVHTWADRCIGCNAVYPKHKGDKATVWHLAGIGGLRPEVIAARPVAEVVAKAKSRADLERIATIKALDSKWVDRAMTWAGISREAAE